MTTTETAPDGVSPGEPTRNRGSLLRAETRRLMSRRFIRLLVLLTAVGYVVIVAITGLTQYAKADAARLAKAEQAAQQAFESQAEHYKQCIDDASRPAEVPDEEYCGPETSREDFRTADFLSPSPFALADGLPSAAVAVGAGTAALAFLLGATFIGAEWSSRSIVALLFWEPRRLRVMGVKLLVTAGAAALLAVVAQASWVVMAEVLARTRGTRAGLEADFWSDLLAQQARTVLLVVLVALAGFGLANLTRNTGAALGIMFVYFAVLETAVRVAWPAGQQFLLTDNAAALLLQGGHRIFIYQQVRLADGSYTENTREIVLSNPHGGLVIAAVTATVVFVGLALFKKRDLT